MKTAYSFLLVSFYLILSGCDRSVSEVGKDPDPVINKAAYFNQVNTTFRASHADCLLSQWYGNKYQSGPPIAFLVISDPAAYAALFPCSLTTSLPPIDFTTSSLLVGMKADNGRFVNSPVNITSIEQTLIQNTSSTPTLQVKVVGQRGTQGFGTEWFAFTSVVPKVTGTVALDIQYQFK